MTATAADPILDDPRTAAIADALADRGVAKGSRIIVIGCGSGQEAAVLADRLGAEVVGIDIVDNFNPAAARFATLVHGDATALSFPSESFDWVYSYHAIEHIPDYHAALSEMRRVLKPGGRYYIGTPNRHRLVGYIGGRTTWSEKLRWNATDLRARLSGRFRNELGAHAGYTKTEFQGHLGKHFSTVENVTNDYYLRAYSRHRTAVGGIAAVGLGTLLFPCIYFTGSR